MISTGSPRRSTSGGPGDARRRRPAARGAVAADRRSRPACGRPRDGAVDRHRQLARRRGRAARRRRRRIVVAVEHGDAEHHAGHARATRVVAGCPRPAVRACAVRCRAVGDADGRPAGAPARRGPSRGSGTASCRPARASTPSSSCRPTARICVTTRRPSAPATGSSRTPSPSRVTREVEPVQVHRVGLRAEVDDAPAHRLADGGRRAARSTATTGR